MSLPSSRQGLPRGAVLVTATAVSACSSSTATGASVQVVPFAVAATVAATLGLLHLLLFAFETRDRRNLFLALLSVSFALVVIFDYRERIGDPAALPGLGYLQRWAVSALVLAAARFAYSLFREGSPRRFKVYLVTIGALLGVSLIYPDTFDLPATILGLVVTADALLSVLTGWRRLESGAWVVALGAGIFCVGGIVQLTVDLTGRSDIGDAASPYLWGGLALLVSSSIFLARTFARTRRELEWRLVEVEELSARTLAQERSAREEEVRRLLVEAENERRREELEAARQLQVAMLPIALPAAAGYELAASMTTATEVGGDYYDAAVASDGSLWIALGDAVGHGARAGTLVAITKSYFKGGLVESDTAAAPPAAALEGFDTSLRGMGLERAHMALTLARLRGSTLELASAGMPPTLVRRRRGPVEEIVFSSLPLGSPLRQRYQTQQVELEPGDVVLFLSDGLAELPVRGDVPLGYDGVRDLVAAAPPVTGDAGQERGERELERWLLGLLAGQLGEATPPDDITILAALVSAAGSGT